MPQGMEIPWLTYQQFSNLIGNLTDMIVEEQNWQPMIDEVWKNEIGSIDGYILGVLYYNKIFNGDDERRFYSRKCRWYFNISDNKHIIDSYWHSFSAW